MKIAYSLVFGLLVAVSYREASAANMACESPDETFCCGNGSCEPGETFEFCSEDCDCPTGEYVPEGPIHLECGNGACDPDEDCDLCPLDCGECDYCGDGICEMDVGEDCYDCAEDCPTCWDHCGDGTCQPELDETQHNCSPDCGEEPDAGTYDAGPLEADAMTDEAPQAISGGCSAGGGQGTFVTLMIVLFAFAGWCLYTSKSS